LKEQDWDYFQYVDIGLDRVHQRFWNYSDPQHLQYEAGNPYENVIPDYYAWLDEQVGLLMDSLPSDTALLLASDRGAQGLEGEFAINQWLAEDQLLVFDGAPPEGVVPFEELNVDWGKTRVWSEGGRFARVYINVMGRQPEGAVPASEYAAFRDELKAKFEALADRQDQPLVVAAFRPDQIYSKVNGAAPDLVVQFRDYWRAIDSVGHPALYLQGSHSGLDFCGDSQYGIFILVAPNNPLAGELEGVDLLDLTPTLLDLAGYQIPDSMQGRSLVANMEKRRANDPDEEQRLIHDRLAGLGYV